jgi:integrase
LADTSCNITAEVTEEPSLSGDYTVYSFKGYHKTLKQNIRFNIVCENLGVKTGDKLNLNVTFSELEGAYTKSNLSERKFIRAGLDKVNSVELEADRFYTFFGRVRKQIEKIIISKVNTETGGLLIALLTGNRDLLSDELYSAAKACGVSHILVVSGLHLSILCGFINQIFNHAVLDGDILFNPCTSVKIPKAKKNPPRSPASISDEQKILESSHKWLFPLVALLTGLRKGEILALQWQDINFEDKCISVTKSVEHIGKKPHLKEPKTKSGTRTVPLLDMLALRLLPLADKPNLFIFSEDGGRSPLYEHRYTKFYKEYQQEVGITATAHQLRHSYATIAVELDVNPKDLQATLGHADISTTMNVYAAVRKKSIEKVAEKLNERYRNN